MTLPRPFLYALPIALLAGCSKSDISYYRIPKEVVRAESASNLPPSHPSINSTATQTTNEPAGPADNLVWTAPSHWEKKPLGMMRRGSFRIRDTAGKEADLSVFVFPGAAGGLADNVNRWRGQIGLDPLTEPKLAETLTRQNTPNGLEFTVVDMTGTNGERILGAILPRGPNSWFLKLKGPAELVGTEKAAFIAFLNSIKAP